MTGDDHELLMAWRTGDRRAGAALFDRHFASVRRFFINKACTESEVEELVQRTFVASLESAERFRGDASVKTWLLSIARNIQREWIREVMREALDPVEPDAMCSEKLGPGFATGLEVKREQQILLTALRRLPLEQQTLLELFYWEELTAGELVEVFGGGHDPHAATQGQARPAQHDRDARAHAGGARLDPQRARRLGSRATRQTRGLSRCWARAKPAC